MFYGRIILPFTLLRRMDCVLEPTRDMVRSQYRRWPITPAANHAISASALPPSWGFATLLIKKPDRSHDAGFFFF